MVNITTANFLFPEGGMPFWRGFVSLRRDLLIAAGRRGYVTVFDEERRWFEMPQGPQMPAMPLSMARPGDTVTVFRVKGAGDVKRHLETLGFVEGSQVHVVTSGGGNIIVLVKGARFGLDAKVARNVMVA